MNIKLSEDITDRIRSIVKSQKGKKLFGISSISEEQLIVRAIELGLFDIENLVTPRLPDEVTGLY